MKAAIWLACNMVFDKSSDVYNKININNKEIKKDQNPNRWEELDLVLSSALSSIFDSQN